MVKAQIYRVMAIVLCVCICHGKCCGRGYIHNLHWMKDGKIVNSGISWGKNCSRKSRFNTCREYEKKRPPICIHYKCNRLNRLAQIFSQSVWTGYLKRE